MTVVVQAGVGDGQAHVWRRAVRSHWHDIHFFFFFLSHLIAITLDNVTADGLREHVAELLKSPLSYAVYGNVDGLPSYDQLLEVPFHTVISIITSHGGCRSSVKSRESRRKRAFSYLETTNEQNHAHLSCDHCCVKCEQASIVHVASDLTASSLDTLSTKSAHVSVALHEDTACWSWFCGANVMVFSCAMI